MSARLADVDKVVSHSNMVRMTQGRNTLQTFKTLRHRDDRAGKSGVRDSDRCCPTPEGRVDSQSILRDFRPVGNFLEKKSLAGEYRERFALFGFSVVLRYQILKFSYIGFEGFYALIQVCLSVRSKPTSAPVSSEVDTVVAVSI